MVNRALYAVLAVAAVFATLLLLLWPAGSWAPTPPSSPLRSTIDEPPNPDAPPPPSSAPETPVARLEIEVPGPPTVSAPASSEATGSVVLRGTIAIWGETKPFPVMRVRARDVETGETLLEVDSSPDGTYVLSREFPVSRAPFQVLVEGEGEGLTSGFWSRVVEKVRSVPFSGFVASLSLHRATEIHGRVVELFTGNPIAGARVSQVWRNEWEQPRGLDGKLRCYSKATTGPSGEFRARVPALLRRAKILVEAEGYLPRLVQAFGEAGAGTIDVQLTRSDQVPRVTGRVLGPDGRPAVGARVDVEVPWTWIAPALPGPLGEALVSYGSALDETGRRESQTITDEEGQFSFQSPNLGTWRLVAWTGESGSASAYVEVTEVRSYECEIRFPSDAIVFVGLVRARSTGLPIADVPGWAVPSGLLGLESRRTSPRMDAQGLFFALRGLEDRLKYFQTDDRGEFRVGPVPRGSHRFAVQAKSFASASLEVAPVPGDTETRFVLELEEECRLRGTFSDEEGKSAGFLTVVLKGPPADLPAQWKGDGSGGFEVVGLPANVELEFALRLRPLGGDGVESGSDPVTIRFSAPGEERDLGRVVLLRK